MNTCRNVSLSGLLLLSSFAAIATPITETVTISSPDESVSVEQVTITPAPGQVASVPVVQVPGAQVSVVPVPGGFAQVPVANMPVTQAPGVPVQVPIPVYYDDDYYPYIIHQNTSNGAVPMYYYDDDYYEFLAASKDITITAIGIKYRRYT